MYKFYKYSQTVDETPRMCYYNKAAAIALLIIKTTSRRALYSGNHINIAALNYKSVEKAARRLFKAQYASSYTLIFNRIL